VRVTRGTSAEKGRVIALFGPPGAGLTALAHVIRDASNLDIAVLRDTEEQALPERADFARMLGAAVVIMDGFPSFPEDIKKLYDARLVYPGSGAVVRVVTDPELCVRRGYKTPDEVLAFNKRLPLIEEAIRGFNLPYYVVHNDDLEQAALDLAKRAQITD